jgi:hypothetical protein
MYLPTDLQWSLRSPALRISSKPVTKPDDLLEPGGLLTLGGIHTARQLADCTSQISLNHLHLPPELLDEPVAPEHVQELAGALPVLFGEFREQHPEVFQCDVFHGVVLVQLVFAPAAPHLERV